MIQQGMLGKNGATRLITPGNELGVLGLPTLSYRRKRADVIQIFRILSGIDDIDTAHIFELQSVSKTRGPNIKIFKSRSHFRVRN